MANYFGKETCFSYSLWCFYKSRRIAWLRTDAQPALQSLQDERIPVFNVYIKKQQQKKTTALKSVNISKEEHKKC